MLENKTPEKLFEQLHDDMEFPTNGSFMNLGPITGMEDFTLLKYKAFNDEGEYYLLSCDDRLLGFIRFVTLSKSDRLNAIEVTHIFVPTMFRSKKMGTLLSHAAMGHFQRQCSSQKIKAISVKTQVAKSNTPATDLAKSMLTFNGALRRSDNDLLYNYELISTRN